MKTSNDVMSLVTAAKSIEKKHKQADSKIVELTLAWARGEVTNMQVSVALGKSRSGVGIYSIMACAFRTALKTGRIIENT